MTSAQAFPEQVNADSRWGQMLQRVGIINGKQVGIGRGRRLGIGLLQLRSAALAPSRQRGGSGSEPGCGSSIPQPVGGRTPSITCGAPTPTMDS